MSSQADEEVEAIHALGRLIAQFGVARVVVLIADITSGTTFPRIGFSPYSLALGRYGFYSFTLSRPRARVAGRPEADAHLGSERRSEGAEVAGVPA